MKTRYRSLPGILEDIRDSSRIVAGVILTYEFDPVLTRTLATTELLQLDDDPNSDGFRFEAAFPACLFYDPKRHRNHPSFPGNFEIHFASKDGYACHHSKAYAFELEDGSFILVLGSMNLTESGLFKNRETLLEFRLQPDTTEDEVVGVFRQWHEFLTAHYQETHSPSASLTRYLDDLHNRLKPAPAGSNTIKLIYSGYDEQSGLDRLRQFCSDQRVGSPSRLLVVSPFFDRNEDSNVLTDFLQAFPTLKFVSVFSSFDKWGNGYFQGFDADKIRCFCIPNKTTLTERQAIDEFHRGARASLKKTEVEFQRSLHAKILLLLDDNGDGALYVGSANFSRKAWLGKNYELGAALRVRNFNLTPDWDSSFVINLLGVEDVRSVYPSENVSSVPPEAEDNDSVGPVPPDWLESILLAQPITQSKDEDGLSEQGSSLRCQFRFLLREGKEFPHPTSLRNKFTYSGWKFDKLDKVQIDESNTCLVSEVFKFDDIKDRLQSDPVIEMHVTDDPSAELNGTVYIPFNIDPTFGNIVQFTVEVSPEAGLRFLTGLCALEQSSEIDAETIREERESLIRSTRSTSGKKVEEKLTKTHVMRRWISELGKLENALIKPGKPGESDKLKVSVLRPDPFVHLSAYGKSLLRTDLAFGGINVTPIEKTFMLMELAILASRLVLAARSADITITREQSKAVRDLVQIALDWESRNSPPSPQGQAGDTYRQLLLNYSGRFMGEAQS